MLTLVWSCLFFLFAVVGSIVGAIAMIGMPVAPEIEAILVVLAGAAVISGLAALLVREPPTFRDRDPIPPYFIGLNGQSNRRVIGP
jgi:hypothetical protein